MYYKAPTESGLFFGLVFGLYSENKTIMKTSHELNAGPMADIAFLLLIFFLVATTMNAEKGIQRNLPQDDPNPTSSPLAKRNLLLISVNNENKIMADETNVSLAELRPIVKAFILNNGDGSCTYCPIAIQDPNSSDNPKKAVIGIDVQVGTSYEMYVAVQNEVSAALNSIRQEYAQRAFLTNFEDLSNVDKRQIKKDFPLLLSENVLRLD